MPAFCCLLLNDFRLQHQDIGISGISAAAVARIAGTKEGQARPPAGSEYDDAGALRRSLVYPPARKRAFLVPTFNLPVAIVGTYPAIFAAVFNPPANSLTCTFTVTSIDALVER
jgi:hypothetical protein